MRLSRRAEFLRVLLDTEKWLKRSYKNCRQIGTKKYYKAEEFDEFELLTSRFRRTIDILINKVYRAIDYLEMENQGLLIDIIKRTYKRNLIDSVDEIRELKEMRNKIEKVYSNKELKEIFDNVFNYTPLVFDLIKRTLEYCEKHQN